MSQENNGMPVGPVLWVQSIQRSSSPVCHLPVPGLWQPQGLTPLTSHRAHDRIWTVLVRAHMSLRLLDQNSNSGCVQTSASYPIDSKKRRYDTQGYALQILLAEQGTSVLGMTNSACEFPSQSFFMVSYTGYYGVGIYDTLGQSMLSSS